MRILMIAINDPAGTAILFTKAINQHTAHTCRLVTLETRYNHDWDKDLHIPHCNSHDLDELENLLSESVISHFQMAARVKPLFNNNHAPRISTASLKNTGKN